MKLDDLLEHCKLSKEQLKQVCVDKHLVAISKFIGCWETCASHFELTQAEIEEIKADGRNHEQRKLFMLQKWREKKAFLATFGALVGIFLKCDNALMAQNVCDVLKQGIYTHVLPCSYYKLQILTLIHVFIHVTRSSCD